MKKPPILLAAFLLASVGANAPKDGARLSYDPGVGGVGGPLETAAPAQPAASGYPPCRPGRGDDRCIQLYERGVRSAPPRTAAPRASGPAMGGPIEGIAAYPHCSRLITDECVQLFDRATRPARATPVRRRAPAPDVEPSTPGI